MKRVLFVGGAKGTGKSTLCKILSDKSKMKVINTGDFFSLYNVSKEETKQRIILSIIKESPIIVDTHYTGFANSISDGNFERALFPSELEILSKKVDLHPVLVDINIETLIRRRENDKSNQRDMNFLSATRELEHNRKNFLEYCQELRKKGYIIMNYNLDNSIKELFAIYKEVFR